MNYEQKVMGIISNGGTGRSLSMKAIEEARAGNYDNAQILLDQANESLLSAHKIQTELIQEEARGNSHPITILMVHAQDHLMNAMTVKDLAVEMIEIIKENKRVKN
ncbi:PTS lactose/cellobiose transporter subunit IIA [Oceanobacillus oncorhynchi]|uniref:PTS lactose/cellobiose transporter subunit IIA n=1 Tax=Oceanobacillus oncorhynchi TaxID=545501 RepID=UPI0034D675F5